MDVEGAALAYLARKWAVVPLAPRDKRPLVRWQAFQHEPPTRRPMTVAATGMELAIFALR